MSSFTGLGAPPSGMQGSNAYAPGFQNNSGWRGQPQQSGFYGSYTGGLGLGGGGFGGGMGGGFGGGYPSGGMWTPSGQTSNIDSLPPNFQGNGSIGRVLTGSGTFNDNVALNGGGYQGQGGLQMPQNYAGPYSGYGQMGYGGGRPMQQPPMQQGWGGRGMQRGWGGQQFRSTQPLRQANPATPPTGAPPAIDPGPTSPTGGLGSTAGAAPTSTMPSSQYGRWSFGTGANGLPSWEEAQANPQLVDNAINMPGMSTTDMQYLAGLNVGLHPTDPGWQSAETDYENYNRVNPGGTPQQIAPAQQGPIGANAHLVRGADGSWSVSSDPAAARGGAIRKATGGLAMPHMADGGTQPLPVNDFTRQLRFAGDTQGATADGLLHSAVAGRTDRLPMSVASGSYIMPADLVSGLGEGNSLAGAHLLSQMFGTGPYGAPNAHPGASHPIPRPPPAPGNVPTASLARGGSSPHDKVDILAAGGEYVIPPEKVRQLGNGDINHGHDILDRFVVKQRKKIAQTMLKLPGPKAG